MKSKLIRRMLAAVLSTSMIMGTSVTALAADTVEVDAPIYAYDVVNVIVPTVYAVAFNPDGLTVTNGAVTNTDQIVSKNYGIINKSTKDKIVTVELKVQASDERIEFVTSEADATTNAEADEYKIYLAAVPADATEVKVGATPASATETTTAAELADVTMTKASGNDVVLTTGSNEFSFALPKATYGLKDGETLDLGSTAMADVKGKFEVKSLASTGNKGITAFTLGGAMNTKADWSKMATGVKITAVYSNETAPDGADANIASGTGALYENPLPVFKSKAIGQIKYNAGKGDDAITSITSITMVFTDGNSYDGYNSLDGSGGWAHAVDENGVITIDSAYMDLYAAAYPDETTREAVITYVNANSDTVTATVDVMINTPVSEAPVFTGDGVGKIAYTTGKGDDAIASITSITMIFTDGNNYDGYNSLDGSGGWAHAVDENGVVTIDSAYMGLYATAYPDEATKEAVITYVNAAGTTKTATVDVAIR